MKTHKIELAAMETINNINKLGYLAYFNGVNCNNTAYIEVEKDCQPFFKIRISDHDLPKGSYLPAGVINKTAYWYEVPIDILEDYIGAVERLDDEELEELWSNRIIT